jgi:hypothetical protein
VLRLRRAAGATRLVAVVSVLLALDPGLRYPAVAIFNDGVLVHASRVKIPGTSHKLERGMRCLNVARLINVHVSPFCPVDELVIEWPRCYAKLKGDPADLFPLAGVGMALAGMLGVPVSAPTAPEWIGNVPKSVGSGDALTSARGHRIWSRLSDAERSCVVVSHDSLDSCGLGLWRLGRLERRQSFIGASQ